MRRSFFSPLCSLIGVGLIAACAGGGRDERAAGDSALARDPALVRDLTLANAAPATPELRDVPLPERAPETVAPPRRTAPPRRAPRPTVRVAEQPPAAVPPAPTPAPEPVAAAPTTALAAPERRVGVIEAGTSGRLTIAAAACSDGGRPGDKMVARTSEALVGSNGVVFPAGSAAVVEIASIVQSPSADSSRITFRIKSITVDDVTYPVTGEVIPEGTLEKTRVEAKGSDRKKVIGGAIAGAILGGVVGDAKGAVIGAAAGGAAGAAVAASRVYYRSCLPAGAAMRFTLAQAVEIAL